MCKFKSFFSAENIFNENSFYKKKDTLVKKIFSNIAPKYDLMNNIMSFGIHHIWKERLCDMIPNMNSSIIDIASGTGDIAFRLKRKATQQNCNTKIVISDINSEMLDICESKAIDYNMLENFDVVVANAEKLPFPDNSFDYYTIAFGIRNVISIQEALSEALRVLKPTGKFLCLEFTKVQNRFMKYLYDFYLFHVIPKVGQYITKNQDAYEYLARSIQLFPNQEDFKTIIQKTGFTNVQYKNLTFSAVAIHYGYKG